MYECALALYQQKHYERAKELFAELCTQTPWNRVFWKGLAACLHMQSAWKEAIRAWSITLGLHAEDPWCHYHLGECFLAIDEHDQAVQAFILAKQHTNDSDLLSRIANYEEHFSLTGTL